MSGRLARPIVPPLVPFAPDSPVREVQTAQILRIQPVLASPPVTSFLALIFRLHGNPPDWTSLHGRRHQAGTGHRNPPHRMPRVLAPASPSHTHRRINMADTPGRRMCAAPSWVTAPRPRKGRVTAPCPCRRPSTPRGSSRQASRRPIRDFCYNGVRRAISSVRCRAELSSATPNAAENEFSMRSLLQRAMGGAGPPSRLPRACALALSASLAVNPWSAKSADWVC